MVRDVGLGGSTESRGDRVSDVGGRRQSGAIESSTVRGSTATGTRSRRSAGAGPRGRGRRATVTARSGATPPARSRGLAAYVGGLVGYNEKAGDRSELRHRRGLGERGARRRRTGRRQLRRVETSHATGAVSGSNAGGGLVGEQAATARSRRATPPAPSRASRRLIGMRRHCGDELRHRRGLGREVSAAWSATTPRLDELRHGRGLGSQLRRRPGRRQRQARSRSSYATGAVSGTATSAVWSARTKARSRQLRHGRGLRDRCGRRPVGCNYGGQWSRASVTPRAHLLVGAVGGY